MYINILHLITLFFFSSSVVIHESSYAPSFNVLALSGSLFTWKWNWVALVDASTSLEYESWTCSANLLDTTPGTCPSPLPDIQNPYRQFFNTFNTVALITFMKCEPIRSWRPSAVSTGAFIFCFFLFCICNSTNRNRKKRRARVEFAEPLATYYEFYKDDKVCLPPFQSLSQPGQSEIGSPHPPQLDALAEFTCALPKDSWACTEVTATCVTAAASLRAAAKELEALRNRPPVGPEVEQSHLAPLIEELAILRSDRLAQQVEISKLKEAEFAYLADISRLEEQALSIEEVSSKLRRDVEVRDLTLALAQSERGSLTKELREQRNLVADLRASAQVDRESHAKELEEQRNLVSELRLSETQLREQLAGQNSEAKAAEAQAMSSRRELQQEALRLSGRLLQSETECNALRKALEEEKRRNFVLRAKIVSISIDDEAFLPPSNKLLEDICPSQEDSVPALDTSSAPQSSAFGSASNAGLIEGELTLEDLIYSRSEQAEMRAKGHISASDLENEAITSSTPMIDSRDSAFNLDISPLTWSPKPDLPWSIAPIGSSIPRELAVKDVDVDDAAKDENEEASINADKGNVLIPTFSRIPVPDPSATPVGTVRFRKHVPLSRSPPPHRRISYPLGNIDINKLEHCFKPKLMQDEKQVKQVPPRVHDLTLLPSLPSFPTPPLVHHNVSPANPFLRSASWSSPTRIPRFPSSPRIGCEKYRIHRGLQFPPIPSLLYESSFEASESPTEIKRSKLPASKGGKVMSTCRTSKGRKTFAAITGQYRSTELL